MPYININFEGKNLEEAIKKASLSLGLKENEVKYKILEKKKKLFSEKVVIQVEARKEIDNFFDKIFELSNQMLLTFFDYIGVKGKVLYPVLKDNYSFIRIETDNDFLFVKNQAKILISIQLLLNTMIKKNLNFDPRIVLDCKDYRLHRSNFLREIAISKAEEVKKTGRIFIFKQLEPYERKIIHMTLQDDPDVYTESEGINRYKRLKIIPVKKKDENK